MSKHTFLGKEVTLREHTIREADEIQETLMEGAINVKDAEAGEASFTLKAFNASKLLTIVYGTADEYVNAEYIQGLGKSKSKDVDALYDAIVKFNNFDESQV